MTAVRSNSTEPNTASRGTRWWSALPLLGFVTAGAFVARAPSLGRGLFDPDEAAIATMGMVVTRGGVLYRDVIDRKPPVAPLLYALSFWLTGSRHLEPLHVLAALELAGAALVIAYEVRRRAGTRAAWWTAGLLLAGAVAFHAADAQAANYSHLALLPACGAIVAARRGTGRSAVAAGVLLGVAVLTRQTWAIGVVPAAFAAWWHGGRRIGRAAVVVVATIATVAAVAIVVPFGPFVHWTFSGNGSLLLDLGQSRGVLSRGASAFELFIVGHLALCWLVFRRGWHRDDLDLWLWTLAGLVSVVAGFRYFGHYWLQVLPALCLLGGPAIATSRAWTRVVLAGLVVVPTFVFWQEAWTPIHGHSNIDVRVFALVDAVRRHTDADDWVTVWGSLPEVYWLSGRAPGGALVITDFLVGKAADLPDGRQRLADATPGALADYLAALRAHPPQLFLDTSTGRVRKYQYYPVKLIPSVYAFLTAHYHRIGTAAGVTIYEHQTVRAAPSVRPERTRSGVGTREPWSASQYAVGVTGRGT